MVAIAIIRINHTRASFANAWTHSCLIRASFVGLAVILDFFKTIVELVAGLVFYQFVRIDIDRYLGLWYSSTAVQLYSYSCTSTALQYIWDS